MSGKTERAVHIFGVRHLSPGGAQHLKQFLHDIQPTAVLIEGPSDATPEIRHLVNKATKPPVALLAFTADLPMRTAMWPLAVYSPEYQAMKWAEEQGAYCAFIDLPSSVMLALEREQRGSDEGGERDEGDEGNSGEAAAQEEERLHSRSLYDRIAELAGEHDYEMYWERHYEHNLSRDAYRQAILSSSAQMREWTEEEEWITDRKEYAYNALRELYMLSQIEAAIAAGHAPERIVVVCGAYHASALATLPAGMTDAEFAALPKRNTKLTLMPYSYYRLSSMSGYGAGNRAPLYFEMMWEAMEQGQPQDLAYRYLSQVAGRLRKSGTHRSTAEVIEAVRLAQSLAALHEGSAPTLRDLHDAAQSIFGHGELSVVAEPLASSDVGTAIGELAEGVSQTPIQDDLNRQFKRLKLDKYKSAVAADLALDLRENRRVKSEEAAYLDLHRSVLLHRMQLLGITFARKQASGQDSATWAEHWVLQWKPEVEIEVVESTLLGETIELAAAFRLQQRLESCTAVSDASALIRVACECAMLSQMEAARETLQKLAIDSQDVGQIAGAAHQLAIIIGYGDIRKLDTAPLLPLLEQLFLRACLFLVDACGCNDEASGALLTAINELNQIAQEHHELVDEALWVKELHHLASRDDRNPRLSGYACAILLERGELSVSECAEEVSRRLSPGVPADLGAGWFEGLSMRNRYGLLSRLSLWEQLNEYIAELDDEEFRRALVFLRRAFSSFNSREKTMVAEMLGEIWGVDAETAAEVLTGELKEAEEQMLDDLNDFDFGDL
ncbi:DUF5682 family protein [Paenibacillus sp. GCM10027626]|uniref:DUF5682 family protein n=1 Tax=Paenibacillus sp. GCM10027626 TaxID=3273411 RepID=UPI003629AEFF